MALTPTRTEVGGDVADKGNQMERSPTVFQMNNGSDDEGNPRGRHEGRRRTRKSVHQTATAEDKGDPADPSTLPLIDDNHGDGCGISLDMTAAPITFCMDEEDSEDSQVGDDVSCRGNGRRRSSVDPFLEFSKRHSLDPWTKPLPETPTDETDPLSVLGARLKLHRGSTSSTVCSSSTHEGLMPGFEEKLVVATEAVLQLGCGVRFELGGPMRVEQLTAGGWADAQGLQLGDELRRINECSASELQSKQDLISALQNRPLRLFFLRAPCGAVPRQTILVAAERACLGVACRALRNMKAAPQDDVKRVVDTGDLSNDSLRNDISGEMKDILSACSTVQEQVKAARNRYLKEALISQTLYGRTIVVHENDTQLGMQMSTTWFMVTDVEHGAWAMQNGVQVRDMLFMLDEELTEELSKHRFFDLMRRRPLRLVFLREAPVEEASGVLWMMAKMFYPNDSEDSEEDCGEDIRATENWVGRTFGSFFGGYSPADGAVQEGCSERGRLSRPSIPFRV